MRVKPERGERGHKPIPPRGVIGYLDHYRLCAIRARDKYKREQAQTPEVASHIVNQTRYWSNVASALQWVMGQARRTQKAKHRRQD
jgi:hypothetical protein